MEFPISLRQVQAIQGARAGGTPQVRPAPWRKLRRVHAGTAIAVAFGATGSVIGSAKGVPTSCGPVVEVVAEQINRCPPLTPFDPNSIETIAAGVSEGLRRAPLVSTSNAPWVEPDFRGVRYPQTNVLCLSTFTAGDVRAVQVRRAMAGYLGLTAYPVPEVVATAGTPATVLSFRAPDSYVGDSFEVCCQDHEILYLAKWTATINGKVQAGPFALVEGKAKLNLQAKRDETLAINVILASGDSFAVGLEVILNGWTFPSLKSTDGTYNRTLRQSPNWFRAEGVAS